MDEDLRFHFNDRSSIHDSQHTLKKSGILQLGQPPTYQYSQTMKLQLTGTNSSHTKLFHQPGFRVSLQRPTQVEEKYLPPSTPNSEVSFSCEVQKGGKAPPPQVLVPAYTHSNTHKTKQNSGQKVRH